MAVEPEWLVKLKYWALSIRLKNILKNFDDRIQHEIYF